MLISPYELAKVGFIGGTVLKAVTTLFPLRQHKSMGVEILYVAQFSTIDRDTHSDLQLRYPSQDSLTGYAIRLEIKNIGRSPITRNDLITPIKISFGDNAKILKVDVIREIPPDVAAVVQIVDNNIHVLPPLLNSNDSVELEVLLYAQKIRLAVSGRIVGITKLKRRIPRHIKDVVDVTGLYLMLSGLLILDYTSTSSTVGGALIGIGGLLLWIYPRFIHPNQSVTLKYSIGRRYPRQDKKMEL